MNFVKTQAAIAAIQALLASHESSKALAAYDRSLAQSSANLNEKETPGDKAAPDKTAISNRSSIQFSIIPDFVLQTLFNRIELAAEAFHTDLLKEQDYIDQLIHAAGFFSQLNFWFRQIRSLNGDELVSDELYELEAETNALVLKTK